MAIGKASAAVYQKGGITFRTFGFAENRQDAKAFLAEYTQLTGKPGIVEAVSENGWYTKRASNAHGFAVDVEA